MQIELRSITADTAIHYTLDGKEPTVHSQVYEKPILLDRTTTVRAFAKKAGYPLTPVITAHFHKIPHDWSIHLRSRYSKQYTAGGDIALIDGLRGSNNFRAGGWQGYRRNMDATIDMGRKRKIQRIRAGFLQEIASWIWMPKEVEFLVSDDGKDFKRVARFDAGVSDRDYEKRIKNYDKQLDGVEARYVRVKARNYGSIPEWHLGKGGRAWIFADEIEIKTDR